MVSRLQWRGAASRPDFNTGDLQGFLVEARGFPRTAFLKPGIAQQGPARFHAAREKIASDLAFDLGLPVPPAILWRRPRGGEMRVVLSLVKYPRQLAWAFVEQGEMRPPGIDTALATRAFRSASGMLAFDAWVDQHEHARHHPGNIVWGFDPSDPPASGIVFLDYANALGSGGQWWTPENRIEEPGFPSLLLPHLDPTVLDEVVRRIEGFSLTALTEIVDRVPDDFLPRARSLR